MSGGKREWEEEGDATDGGRGPDRRKEGERRVRGGRWKGAERNVTNFGEDGLARRIAEGLALESEERKSA